MLAARSIQHNPPGRHCEQPLAYRQDLHAVLRNAAGVAVARSVPGAVPLECCVCRAVVDVGRQVPQLLRFARLEAIAESQAQVRMWI